MSEIHEIRRERVAEIKSPTQQDSPEHKQFHPNLRENMGDYESKYGAYHARILDALDISQEESRALISHESKFNKSAKNIGGSAGYMQLTSAPINDLFARPDRYQKLFQKIGNMDQEGMPNALKTLFTLFLGDRKELLQYQLKFRGREAREDDNPNKGAAIKLLAELKALKGDPHTNLLIGSLCYKGYSGDMERISNEKKEKQQEEIQGKIENICGNPEQFKKVLTKVLAIVPNTREDVVRKILQDIPQDEEKCDHYKTLSKYNGNAHREGGNLFHFDIYAATVLAVTEIQKLNKSPAKEKSKPLPKMPERVPDLDYAGVW